jgi:tetratricopeptide (TPR) repeat protein
MNRLKFVKYLKANFILMVIFLCSCASNNKLQIVTNPKGAEVLISDQFVKDYKSVGKTPAVIDFKKNKIRGEYVYLSVKAKGYNNYNFIVPRSYSLGKIKVNLKAADLNNDAVDKQVQRQMASERQQIKDDYQSQMESMKYNHDSQIQALNDQIRMAQMMTMNQSSLFGEQKRKIAEDLDEKNKKKTQTIFNKTFEIQNALQNKKLAKAGKALAELKSMDPPEGLFLTLEGNFEFLNGRRAKALASYRRALIVDPTNLELATIVRELEKVVGG